MKYAAFQLGLSLTILACQSPTNKDAVNELRSAILAKVALVPNARVSVAYKNLQTDFQFGINDKEMMHAASTMKVPVMMEVFRQAEAGRFALSDSVLVKNEFTSIVDGSSYSMEIGEDSDDSLYAKIGQKMTILELTYQMITVSSNLATNILIDLVRPANVMQTMAEIGAKDIRVLRGVEDIKAYQAGKNNETNAHDLMVVMSAIVADPLFTPDAREQMLGMLSDQKFGQKIPRHLPKSVRIAHKTGSITKIDHDFAIVRPPDNAAYILVVLTKGITEKERARDLIADISKAVFDFHIRHSPDLSS